MKRRTVLILLAFCIAALGGILLAGCATYSVSNDPEVYLSFELSEDGTYAVTGFRGRYVKDLVIPASYRGVPVTTVKESAFSYTDGWFQGWKRDLIKSVTVEEGITTVESYAFSQCSVDLSFFKLPDSVEFIGNGALCNVDVPLSLPKNVKEIGDGAFSESGLCGQIDLTGVKFGNGSFAACNVTSVTFDENLTEIPIEAFSRCNALEEVNFPAGLKKIGSYAFYQTSALNQIAFPDGLEEIANNAFSYSGVRTVSFPDGLLSVGEGAFCGASLEEVVLPDSDCLYGDDAFFQCDGLKRIDFGLYSGEVGPVFVGVAPTRIDVSANNARYAAKGNCLVSKEDEGELLLASEGTEDFGAFTKIGDYACAYRTFETLYVGSNVSEIAGYAFENAEIQSAVIECKSIFSSAFYRAAIGDIAISSEIIDSYAFERVQGMQTVRLEEGVKKVCTQAFRNCLDLQTVYLPASLQDLGILAFMQCYGLNSVYYALEEGTPPLLHAGNFAVLYDNSKGRGYVTLNEDFTIYVHKGVYDQCKLMWSGVVYDEYYRFPDILSSRISLYE